tara:strand:+ start:9690 stop:10442 length:753 start_codon:yes stop_codon:yes gene_type:complete
MNYLNLHTDLLRSESYLGAEPVERATWLNLLAWCATQENGGVIHDASEWSDRKWQQVCGITKEEAHLESDLYSFGSKGGMIVSHYPKDKEEEVKTNRLNGKKGGRPKGVKPKKNQVVNPKETTCPEIAETEGEGKVKENRIEGEGNKKVIIDRIYALYPHKVAKKDGLKAIEKALKITSEEVITESLAAYKLHCLANNISYANPATWFNGHRWEDTFSDRPDTNNRSGQPLPSQDKLMGGRKASILKLNQ